MYVVRVNHSICVKLQQVAKEGWLYDRALQSAAAAYAMHLAVTIHRYDMLRFPVICCQTNLMFLSSMPTMKSNWVKCKGINGRLRDVSVVPLQRTQ